MRHYALSDDGDPASEEEILKNILVFQNAVKKQKPKGHIIFSCQDCGQIHSVDLEECEQKKQLYKAFMSAPEIKEGK